MKNRRFKRLRTSLIVVMSIAILVLASQKAFATNATTWDNTRQGSNATLSQGNLTVTFSNYVGGVKATNYKTAGKWYWETLCNNSPVCSMIGIGNESLDIVNESFSTPNFIGYYGYTGNLYPLVKTYGQVLNAGDVVGIALDIDNRMLKYSVNGVWFTTISLSPWTKYYPVILYGSSIYTGGTTTNFGAKSFKYQPPKGFLAFDTTSFETIATGVSLNKSSVNLNIGESANFLATIIPANATNKNIVWTSSDPTVVSVDQLGKITAIKEGQSVTITAKVANTNLIATCIVNVIPSEKWTTIESIGNSNQNSTSVELDGKLYMLGGEDLEGKSSMVKCFDSVTNTWTNLKSMNFPRSHATSVVFDGKIYVIGGWGIGGYLSSMEVYDPRTDTWTNTPNMKYSRCYHSSVVLDGKIYVIGGQSEYGKLNSVEVYDPKTNSWTTASNMKDVGTLSTAVVLNNKIYVIGGQKSGAKLSKVEVYNPSTDTWTTVANMKDARIWHTSVVLDDKIYVIGGRGGDKNSNEPLSSVEVYNPDTNIWSTLTNMNSTRRQHTSVVVNNKIYAIGGFNEKEYLSSMEMYDPTTNIWTSLPNMSTGKYAHSSFVVNNKIYVMGGINKNKSVSSVDVYKVYSNK